MWPNSQFPADLVTFTEEILNGKLHILCSVFTCFLEKWWLSFLFFTNWQVDIYNDLTNWGVLLDNWLSWEVHLNLFLVVPEHQNSWKNKPVLIFWNMTLEKSSLLWRVFIQRERRLESISFMKYRMLCISCPKFWQWGSKCLVA